MIQGATLGEAILEALVMIQGNTPGASVVVHQGAQAVVVVEAMVVGAEGWLVRFFFFLFFYFYFWGGVLEIVLLMFVF